MCGGREATGSTPGGVEIPEEKRRRSAFWSRAAALLRISLVPEVSTVVGNAGARGAGRRGPFAEGRSKATSLQGLGERSPGSFSGKERESKSGSRAGVRGHGPHVSPSPAASEDASRTGAQPAGMSANPRLPCRVPCRLLAALRAVPPPDCPETPWCSSCRSRRPGWWSEWADFTASWSL